MHSTQSYPIFFVSGHASYSVGTAHDLCVTALSLYCPHPVSRHASRGGMELSNDLVFADVYKGGTLVSESFSRFLFCVFVFFSCFVVLSRVFFLRFRVFFSRFLASFRVFKRFFAFCSCSSAFFWRFRVFYSRFFGFFFALYRAFSLFFCVFSRFSRLCCHQVLNFSFLPFLYHLCSSFQPWGVLKLFLCNVCTRLMCRNKT